MDVISQWFDSYPWYVKWLTITFMVTFGIVLVKGLATLLAETIVNVVSWLIFLPVRLVEKLFNKRQKASKTSLVPKSKDVP